MKVTIDSLCTLFFLHSLSPVALAILLCGLAYRWDQRGGASQKVWSLSLPGSRSMGWQTCQKVSIPPLPVAKNFPYHHCQLPKTFLTTIASCQKLSLPPLPVAKNFPYHHCQLPKTFLTTMPVAKNFSYHHCQLLHCPYAHLFETGSLTQFLQHIYSKIWVLKPNS